MKTVLLSLAAALLVPAALRADDVDIDFDPAVDFAQYKTFAWRGGNIHTNYPGLDNTLVQKRIREAITARLVAKGLRETDEKPDLGVRFRLGAQNRKDVELVPAGWYGRRTRRVVRHYTHGTMVIDLNDASKRELVWRATCTNTANDPSKLEGKINDDVRKAFDRYPPKKK